ncbi:MAG: hypothetical protein LBN10_10145 [Propionibacteriaceae bacterium]|jgi:hypothetical protein|nr:hypothetical protein [Propionibacteriaceae bacterium]
MSIEPTWDQPLDTSALKADDEVVAGKILAATTEGVKRMSRAQRAQVAASMRMTEMAARNRLRLVSNGLEMLAPALPAQVQVQTQTFDSSPGFNNFTSAGALSPQRPVQVHTLSSRSVMKLLTAALPLLRPGQALFGDSNPLVTGTSLASSDRWAVSPLTAWADPVFVGDGVEFGVTHLSAQGTSMAPGWEKGTVVFQTFYAIFALPRPVPHIIIDSRANDILASDLPRAYDRSLVMGIDDEFDKAFTTYVAQDAERKAESLLTDKVRDMLLKVAIMNVEMNGQALIFFGHDPADFTKPEPWAKAFRLRALVADILPDLGEYIDGGSGLIASNVNPVPYQLLPTTNPNTAPRSPGGVALGLSIAGFPTALGVLLGLTADGIIPLVAGSAGLGAIGAAGAGVIAWLVHRRKKIAQTKLDSDFR